MNSRIAFLAAACTLVLVACGKPPSPIETPANPSPPAVEPAPAAIPDVAPVAAPAPIAAGSDKPAAVIVNCATVIEGSDAMQYNVGSITIPASCAEFKITLNHTGTMPIAAMGHNVVITTMADMKAVAADGMGAGAAANYIKPDDARVIAHTRIIGGGESTSASFPVSKLKVGGPYEFFCSFPSHSMMMKGTIVVL